jgi:hypothetical protein
VQAALGKFTLERQLKDVGVLAQHEMLDVKGNEEFMAMFRNGKLKSLDISLHFVSTIGSWLLRLCCFTRKLLWSCPHLSMGQRRTEDSRVRSLSCGSVLVFGQTTVTCRAYSRAMTAPVTADVSSIATLVLTVQSGPTMPTTSRKRIQAQVHSRPTTHVRASVPRRAHFRTVSTRSCATSATTSSMETVKMLTTFSPAPGSVSEELSCL